MDEQTIIDILTKRTYAQRREIAFAYEKRAKKVFCVLTGKLNILEVFQVMCRYICRTWSQLWREHCLARWKQWSWDWWRARLSMTPQLSEDLSRYSTKLHLMELVKDRHCPLVDLCCRLFFFFFLFWKRFEVYISKISLFQGLGTDEDTLIELLCSRSNKELVEIKTAYKESKFNTSSASYEGLTFCT